MGENTRIEWAHHTINLWHGCYEVHKGCDNCYAKQQSNRYHGPDLLWQQQGPRMEIKSAFPDIIKYQKRAEKEDVQYYIFMNSMSDIFEKSMPVVDFKHNPLSFMEEQVYTADIRNMFFKYVDASPNLIFLLLTKRPSNILKMIPQEWIDKPRTNVIFGTSIVDQPTADTLIPQLLAVPGLHFLSMEPLLGPVSLLKFISIETTWVEMDIMCEPRTYPVTAINWVIAGGESGFNARPMNSEWAEYLQKQCYHGGIPFFMKQWGEWMPLIPLGHGLKAADGSNRHYHYEKQITHKFLRSNNQLFYHGGKKDTGSLLGGVNYKEFPI